MTTFGDLRSALQATPSAETWANVCALIETLKGKKMSVEIQTYLADTLAHQWPEDVPRVVPRAWVMLPSGAMKTPKRWNPNVKYCDALDLHKLQVNNKRASALAQSPLLATIRHLDLTHNEISRSGFRDLFSSPNLGELRAIVCSLNYFSKGTLTDVSSLSTSAPKLEHFTFEGALFDGLDEYEDELVAALEAMGITHTIAAYSENW